MLARSTVLTNHVAGLLLLYSNVGAYNGLGICWDRRKNACSNLDWKSFGERRRRWKYKIKVDIREISFEDWRQIS
jgi:hypothetical protein